MGAIVLLLGIAIAFVIGCIIRLAKLELMQYYNNRKIANEMKKKELLEREIAMLEAELAVHEKFKGFAGTSTATPPPTKKD